MAKEFTRITTFGLSSVPNYIGFSVNNEAVTICGNKIVRPGNQFTEVDDCGSISAFATAADIAVFACRKPRLNNKEFFLSVFNTGQCVEVKRIELDREVKALVLWSEGKLLVTGSLLDASKAHLQLWDVEQSFVTSQATASFTRNLANSSFELSFCPGDKNLICCLDPCEAKLLRAEGENMKLFTRISLKEYSGNCHCWLNDTSIVIGGEDGLLRVYTEETKTKEASLRDIATELIGKLSSKIVPQRVLVSRNYLICASKEGLIFFWNISSPNVAWDSCRIAHIPSFREPSAISTLIGASLDNEDKNLVLATNSSVYTFDISNMGSLKLISPLVRYLRCGSEKGIRSLSQSQAYVAHLDEQGFLAVQEENGLPLYHEFPEEKITGVSLHPFSFHVLIGTSNGFKLGFVGMERIEVLSAREVEKHVKSEFSPNGTVFSTAHAASLTIRRLSTSGSVDFWLNLETDITNTWWSQSGGFIAAANQSIVFLISINSKKELWRFETKTFEILDVSIIRDGEVYAVCSDSNIRCLARGLVKSSVLVSHERPCCIGYVLKLDMIVVGTDSGQLLTLLNPKDLTSQTLTETNVRHTSGITRIDIYGEKVCVGDKSGIISLWSVLQSEENLFNPDSSFAVSNRKRATMKEEELLKLGQQLNEFRLEAEQKMELEKGKWGREKQKQKEAYDNRIDTLQEKIHKLEYEISLVKTDNESSVGGLRSLYEAESAQQEAKYREKIEMYIRKLEENEKWFQDLLEEAKETQEREVEQMKVTVNIAHEDWLEERKALKQTIHALESENSHLTETLRKSDEEHKRATKESGKLLQLQHESEIGKLLKELKSTQHELQDISNQFEEIRIGKKALAKEVEDLAERYAHAQEELDKLSAAISAEREDEIALRQRKIQMEVDVRKAETGKEEAERKVAALQKELKQEVLRRRQQEKALLETKSQIAELREVLHEPKELRALATKLYRSAAEF